MGRWLRIGLPVVCSLWLASACVVDVDRAREGFPCDPGDTCGEGLVCWSDICVLPETVPSDGGGSEDGGPTDGGPTDGGSTDGGPTDGGPTDGGPTDGGPTDGGPTDGGPTDGGGTLDCISGPTLSCYEAGPVAAAGVGPCTEGIRYCLSDGTYGACIGDVAPSVEVCNGVDDDCDGQTDEVADGSNPAGCMTQGVCWVAVTGDCAAGCDYGPDYASSEGGGNCTPDGLDNDCDGSVDEGCSCTDPGAACYGLGLGHPTIGVGVCQTGTIGCQGNNIRSCDGQVTPSVEVCNGLDDDCDGQTDEDATSIGGACATGDLGPCADGRWTCAAGARSCEPVHPPLVPPGDPEIYCDGLDEDCDGTPDDGLDVAGASENCAPSRACCSAACVDLVNDRANCGSCGRPCPDDGNPCTDDGCRDSDCYVDTLADGTSCGTDLVCFSGTCSGYCDIGGTLYAAGTRVPPDGCQGCYPAVDPTQLTQSPDGTACGASQVCLTGVCSDGCWIGGVFHASGAVSSLNDCEICDPVTSTTAWSAAPTSQGCSDGNPCTDNDSCSGARTCLPGTATAGGTDCGGGNICDGASACRTGCWIAGSFVTPGTRNPTNQCQVCDPTQSTTAWVNASSSLGCSDGNVCTTGDSCDGTGGCSPGGPTAGGTSCGSALICNGAGSCQSGCWIGGTFRSGGSQNPANECQECRPATSTTTWSNKTTGTSCNGGLGTCQGGVCL